MEFETTEEELLVFYRNQVVAFNLMALATVSTKLLDFWIMQRFGLMNPNRLPPHPAECTDQNGPAQVRWGMENNEAH